MGFKKMLVMFLFCLSAPGMVMAESGNTLFNNGISEFQKGRYQDAIFWFTKLIEKEPFNAKAYKNRGVARLSLQKHHMAIENRNNALSPDEKTDGISANQGPDRKYKDAYEKALADFKSALNLDPDLEGVYSNIGVALYYCHNYREAVAAYNREIDKHPENYSAYFNRALSWVELNAYEKALADLQMVLALKPDEYWAVAYKGDIYLEQNDLSAARQAYKQAMGIDPGNSYAQNKLLLMDSTAATASAATSAAPESENSPKKLTPPDGGKQRVAAMDSPEIIKRKKALKSHTATALKKKSAAPQPLPSGKDATASESKKEPAASKFEAPEIKGSGAEEKETMEAPPAMKDTVAGRPSPAGEKNEPSGVTSKKTGYTIQLGAFLNSANADKLIHTLEKTAIPVRMVKLEDRKKRLWTLVRTGVFPTRRSADKALANLTKQLDCKAVVRPMGCL